MSNPAPAVVFIDACVRLSGKQVLRGATGRVPRGRIVGLVGPNGAGKSTLLRAVCGLVPLEKGSVEIDGAALGRLSRRQIARSVTLLPQSADLAFPFAVQEIVAMGRNPHLGRFQPFGEKDKAVVRWAMQQTSVEDLAERAVTQLSGGEKQRVLLARCLATETPTLLLDEPTASLDILHQLEVIQLLEQFAARGKTVILALHDLNVARRMCGHVLLLHQGRVVAEGRAEDTLSPQHVEQVFGVQVAASHEDGLTFALPEQQRAEP